MKAAWNLFKNSVQTHATLEAWTQQRLNQYVKDVKRDLANSKDEYVTLLAAITVLTTASHDTLGKALVKLNGLGFNLNGTNETDRCLV